MFRFVTRHRGFLKPEAAGGCLPTSAVYPIMDLNTEIRIVRCLSQSEYNVLLNYNIYMGESLGRKRQTNLVFGCVWHVFF